MNKTWFRRLLLSYLPVFFIVTMILFILFFQTLNEQNRSEAMKANIFLAQQVLRITDSSLKSIDYKVLRETLTNQDVSRFFHSSNDNVYDNIQALKAMDELKLNYPIIHSIYFVRFSDGFVFSDGTSSSISDFSDSAFIQSLNNGFSSKWTGVREFKAFSKADGEKVITLVRGFPDSNSKEGLFVVNVSLSALNHLISQMYNPDISFVKLIDLQGNNVFGNATLHANINTNEVFSNFTSDYTGWKVQSGLINGEIIKITLSFYNVWLAFAIAVVFFGIVWVVYVTRRNYKPIQQIVTLIQTYSQKSPASGKDDKNEFKFIQSVLENMMEQTKQFQQQFEENIIIQKKYYLHEVLEGSRQIDEKEWASDLRKFHLQVTGKACVVLMTEMDGYRDFINTNNSHDQSLLKFIVSSTIQETANSFGTCVWAEWTTDHRLTSILWLPDDVDPNELTNNIVHAFRKWVEQNLSFTVTIGQGNMAANLDELRKSYRTAINTLQYKAVLGTNRFIQSEHVPPSKTELHEYIKTIYLINHALRLSDDDWKKHLDLFFAQITGAILPRKAIETLLQFLTQHLDREFSELSKEYLDVWKSTMPELLQFTSDWDTTDELKERIEHVFQTMLENMQRLRDSRRNSALIMEIRSYIEEDYANPNLSLDYLSEKIQVSGKYLSKMFKEEFGENFVDYLIGLRINHAKKMLFETQKPLQEISQEVGYSNYNSFNRSFKKVVGISPRDFRNVVDISPRDFQKQQVSLEN